jgi:hypothetical protein
LKVTCRTHPQNLHFLPQRSVVAGCDDKEAHQLAQDWQWQQPCGPLGCTSVLSSFAPP